MNTREKYNKPNLTNVDPWYIERKIYTPLSQRDIDTFNVWHDDLTSDDRSIVNSVDVDPPSWYGSAMDVCDVTNKHLGYVKIPQHSHPDYSEEFNLKMDKLLNHAETYIELSNVLGYDCYYEIIEEFVDELAHPFTYRDVLLSQMGLLKDLT